MEVLYIQKEITTIKMIIRTFMLLMMKSGHRAWWYGNLKGSSEL